LGDEKLAHAEFGLKAVLNPSIGFLPAIDAQSDAPPALIDQIRRIIHTIHAMRDNVMEFKIIF
jgi:hypothetical protein